MMMGKKSELKGLLDAHDDYAEKRENLENYINSVFSEQEIQIRHVKFYRTGFDVTCETGYYMLDNFNNIIKLFPDYKLEIEFNGHIVIFKFVTC